MDAENLRVDAAKSLRGEYATLLPRWKGVALTAEAERQAPPHDDGNIATLPWANIKFASYPSHGGKFPTLGSSKYSARESVGIAVGERMPLSDLARYKYHIDLGGGGGTTWSGTIDKLAMPGLLFHHLTPTKDYFHDRLIPWKHYVPVSEDLSDLKSKYDWAESHQHEARRIADAGTQFMREMGTPEGFERMFEGHLSGPLRGAIKAYVPISSSRPGQTWRDVLQSMGEDCRIIPGTRYNPFHMCEVKFEKFGMQVNMYARGLLDERCPAVRHAPGIAKGPLLARHASPR